MDEKIKISSRFERWKAWERRCTNSRAYKLAVLAGLIHSPTMLDCLTETEKKQISDAFEEDVNKGLKVQHDICIAVIKQCSRRK